MINLFGDVRPQMAADVAYKLAKNPNRANFLLCSVGGSLADGFAIFDTIRRVPNSIITATGLCASSALVILQAAKIRRATPTTQFMFHLTAFEDLQANKDFKLHYDLVVEHLFRERGIDKLAFAWALKKKIFDADKALKYGFIDYIWHGEKLEKPGLS